MSNLSKALDNLGSQIAMKDYDTVEDLIGEMELHQAAQAELLELQRLQSTVKEFIADYELKGRTDIKGLDYDESQDFIKECCDIV